MSAHELSFATSDEEESLNIALNDPVIQEAPPRRTSVQGSRRRVREVRTNNGINLHRVQRTERTSKPFTQQKIPELFLKYEVLCTQNEHIMTMLNHLLERNGTSSQHFRGRGRGHQGGYH